MKQIIIVACLLSTSITFAQLNWQKGGNNNTPGAYPSSIGSNLSWNAPIDLITHGFTRMHINQDGTFANGTNTSGFIGIGITNPASPLHIVGSQIANTQSWNRGITLSNKAILQWDGGSESGFFMAHPSDNPNGNWYAGINTDQTPNAAVNYAFSVYVNDNLGTPNPLASTQFFKHVLVFEGGFERKVGVNTLTPQRVTEIKSNLNQAPQLRLTTTNNKWIDLETNQFGSLEIQPSSGRTGINAYSDPTATLDVFGDERIRNVQAASPNSILVGVNANGPSDVNVRRLDFNSNPNTYLGGDGQFHTITTPPPVNNVVALDGLTYYNVLGFRVITLGQNVGQTGNPAQLFVDREIPMNNHNLYFTTNGALNENQIGLGYNGGIVLPAKLSVYQIHPQTVASSTIAISGINDDVANAGGVILTGVEGQALGLQTQNTAVNRGAYFTAQNSLNTIGVHAVVPASPTNIQVSYGGFFDVSAQAKANYGVFSRSTGVTNGLNCGIYAIGSGSNAMNKAGQFSANSGNTNAQSVGISSEAINSQTRNVAGDFRVYANPNATNIAVSAFAAPNTPITYPANSTIAVYGNSAPFINSSGNGNGFAGYFDGNVFVNGPANGTGFVLTTSDQQFKTNIDTLSNVMADSILKQLKPKTFFFDTTNSFGLNFSSKKQYGLVAQDVEPILPELIGTQHKPAIVDSAGNIVTQSVDYKALNYNAFISILIKGHQEQQAKIDSILANTSPTTAQNDSLQAEIDSLVAKNNQQDAVINDLNNRLTQLENCLGNLLPLLCQLNQSVIQNNGEDAQQQLRSLIRVDLNDNENIVLDQNVPNPFAESTIIGYSIPASVQKAQIQFYNMSGRLMKVVDITERGAGQLNVFGQDLSSGVYTYTLIADGRVIDTKKMVKEGY